MKHWKTAVIGTGALALLTAATGIAAASPVSADPAVVTTDHGRIRGIADAEARTFLGIPYAAPPTKELGLRWKPPQPAAAWKGVRDATKPGSSCPQPAGFAMTEQSTSEDCLYLNVTTPVDAAGKKLPVIVYLHGGGLAFGAGDLFGGRSLATRGDVVVVTVNYRLGALGFLDHPALDARAGSGLSGDFGLEDQQAALRWVRDNAAAFGGDPRNVTLAGESAGAMSVCAQLASPEATGLFQRAVIESQPCAMPVTPTMYSGPRPRVLAEQQGEALANDVGCDDKAHPRPAAEVADCLLNLDPPAFAKLPGYFGGFGLGPAVGGPVLPVDPAQAIATGRFNKVPVLTGTNHDESRFMVNGMLLQGVPLATETDYRTQLAADFCPPGTASCALSDKAAAQYPASAYGGSHPLALSTALTDSVFARRSLDTDRELARHVPTYSYEFDDQQAPGITGLPSFLPQGAYHTSELGYLFDVGWTAPRTPGQDQLSDQMIAYWTRFARTGDPNGPGTPHWSRFHDGTQVESLAPGPGGIHSVDLASEHEYDFWKKAGD